MTPAEETALRAECERLRSQLSAEIRAGVELRLTDVAALRAQFAEASRLLERIAKDAATAEAWCSRCGCWGASGCIHYEARAFLAAQQVREEGAARTQSKTAHTVSTPGDCAGPLPPSDYSDICTRCGIRGGQGLCNNLTAELQRLWDERDALVEFVQEAINGGDDSSNWHGAGGRESFIEKWNAFLAKMETP